jgi:hypothetical protein
LNFAAFTGQARGIRVTLFQNICLIVVGSVIAVGQSTPPRGDIGFTIRGQVTGPIERNAPAPGIQVRAKNSEIRLARSTITNGIGHYTITGLSPGRYTVGIAANGVSTTPNQEIVIGSKGPEHVLNFALVLNPTKTIIEPITPDHVDALEARLRQARAEHFVERLWGWQLQRIWDVNGQLSRLQEEQLTITSNLQKLNQDALAALLLALKDPDVQMRRNGALMLLDLAAGFSPAARPRLNMSETLPALIDAQVNDADDQVKKLANEVIQQIH